MVNNISLKMKNAEIRPDSANGMKSLVKNPKK
jgi:hypothetical protein